MNALEIRNLTKIYPRGITAVSDLGLTVAKGDFFALLGPNGAGKSTTIGIISSLVNKTGGEVRVFNKDIDKEKSAAKSFLGLVPQEFNFGIFEKVLHIVVNQAGYYGIPAKLAHERAEKYLKKLNLWDKRNDSARTLSGGMKRRLMIARALIHEPQMLILDEPTAGVDIEVRRSMWEFLKEVNRQGVTIVLTTHYLEEAEHLCKNIAIMSHGKIIENSSMKKLLSKLTLETFILDLAEPVAKLPDLNGSQKDFQLRMVDDHTLEVDIHKSMPLNRLFQILSDHKIQITSMRNKANRLEELFISLTGKTEENLKIQQEELK